ncbi:HK97 family phage prohead protease [Acidipropionibacterium acidipropionici]|nr:HK97 family phage prohead protease [Acidipropionibacterium acidipropionici]
MKIKTAPFKVKAGTDKGIEEGTFEGHASVFGNVDSYGDIVDSGAFTRTLGEWAEKGATIPVLWGHNMDDPFANIGGLVSAEEDEKGLKVVGQLDMDNPTAQQVYRLMKGGRTTSMSFAYSVRDAAEKDGANHLKDLDLFEVSVVQVPANELAEIEAVKSASGALIDGMKAGRVLAQKHIDSLHTAYDALGSVIEAAEATDGEEPSDDASKHTSGSSGGKSLASPEEPAGAKGGAGDEATGGGPSVKALAALQAVLLMED